MAKAGALAAGESVFARIVVLPKSMAVTNPLGDTVATLPSIEVQCAIDVTSFVNPSANVACADN